MIEGLAVLFRGFGQAGWLVLIDEQEIVPTLLTTRQRSLCNQNLRVIVDSVNQSMPPRGMYYVFASGTEFFTDPDRGINTYPALRDRIKSNAVLKLPKMDYEEMVEVGRRLVSIAQSAEPESQVSALLTEPVIREFIVRLQKRYGALGYKVRGFVQALVNLARQAGQEKAEHISALMDPILEKTFQSIGDQISSAERGKP